MRSGSTNGSVASQSVICWCCGTMIEKSVLPSGLALRWSVAEAVAEDVGVLRRVGDEALLGESAGEAVVVVVVDLRVGDVLRAALEPVLADDHRPPLARLSPLGTSRMP